MAASSRSSQKSYIIGSDSTENQEYDDEWVSYNVYSFCCVVIFLHTYVRGKSIYMNWVNFAYVL